MQESLEKLNAIVIYEAGIERRRRMIVCSCNIITRREIEAVIESMLAEDPYAVLTPGLIYHRLGRRGRCCGCFPHVSKILVQHMPVVRARLERGEPAGAADDEPAEIAFRPVA